MTSHLASSPLVLSPGPHVLGNGRYTALVSPVGGGTAWALDRALLAWSADHLEDPEGFFIYLRDRENGRFWSAAWKPVSKGPLAPGRRVPGGVVFRREAHGLVSTMEVAVAARDALELRRVTLENQSSRRRAVEVTSFLEVALDHGASYRAHPAFSKLFLQTEHVESHQALLVRRRPRSAGEDHPWLVHALLGDDLLEYETDRLRFLGRGRGRDAPRALAADAPLSGTTGNVLDPGLALRTVLVLEPGRTGSVTFLLGAAPSREEALAAVSRLRTPGAVEEALKHAATREEKTFADLGLSAAEGFYAGELAGAVLTGHPGLRASSEVLARARGNPADLARYGLDPSRAWVVLHAETPEGARHLPFLSRAHRLWRTQRLPIDLVVPTSTLSPDERDLLDAAARLVVSGACPVFDAPRDEPAVMATETYARAAGSRKPASFSGAFSEDGREYVLRLPWNAGAGLGLPPRPWINVVANENFGFLVSETGAGTTWSGNSREHRLTPWSNDPVLDPHSEAFYVRDEETGAFWSALPGPAPGPGSYEVRHGFGYTSARHESHGVLVETLLFTARADPVRVTRIRLRNRTGEPRRLAVHGFHRLVLGGLPEESARFVVTERDPASGALLARNPMAGDFADGVAFATALTRGTVLETGFTADRSSFQGHGTLGAPAALRSGEALNERTGAGLDPCFAQQIVFSLAPEADAEIAFLLGEGSDLEHVRALLDRFGTLDAVAEAEHEVRGFWSNGLSRLCIETPSPALDRVLNGWLSYQVLACRLWARSAFHQSGGAFGFRDQLQDAMALLPIWPEQARAQILRNAAHQFEEGDVLHWWHPPRSRGIRTRFADDLLWLPYLTAHYVQWTGDGGVLDEKAGYLRARALEPGEDEAFLLPVDSGTAGSVYEHCCRAIDRSLAVGRNGLPLFGTGDWNDGMNRVGREGRGESVWMGFFLHAVLNDFAPLCQGRGDTERARGYRRHAEELAQALETAGWDGEWYRRAFYDDGTLLGSHENTECRIDALVQAWSVISKAAPRARAEAALDAVETHLVSEAEKLIRLLAPPFDQTRHDPGYIKGYVPGVRENGGQYTHAALWVVRALAELGRNERAAPLLEMLAPVSHTGAPEDVERYGAEPYVVAADVYGAPPHVGRAGWTWYTGSAGWMLRVALESVLGITMVKGRHLRLLPCVPAAWPGFTVRWRLPGEETLYTIVMRNPHRHGWGVASATQDGHPVEVVDGAALVPLCRDGKSHRVEVTLGASRVEAPVP